MTEIGITSVELSPVVETRLKGSIGIPLHGINYKIKPKGKDKKVGELFVASPITHIREIIGGVEKGVELDEEGYFATGDIAEVDATNRYYLKGRIKDIISKCQRTTIELLTLLWLRKISHHSNNISTSFSHLMKVIQYLWITVTELYSLREEHRRVAMTVKSKNLIVQSLSLSKF